MAGVISDRCWACLSAGALLGLMAAAGGARAESAPPGPIADAHLHYKWNQAEVTSPEEAVASLRANGVVLAVIAGTPPERVLELHALAPEIVVPIFGPYRTNGDWYRWQSRPELVDQARAAIASGPYRGIGELHVIPGFAARWGDSPVLAGLMEVGRQLDVPLLIHMEFSRAEPTLALCQGNPDNRILLAHAGAALPPPEVRRILEACPRVWMDLAARDPWRFLRFPIADAEGRLLPEWRALILDYPERFMVGSDAVWPVERLDAWDQPDTGWQRIHEFLGFHRGWAAELPPEVRARVLAGNARTLFGVPENP